MRPVEPSLHEGAYLIIFAKNQPPYKPLPASVDESGTIMTEWEFSAEDLQRIMTGSRLRLWLMGMDLEKPLTPIKLELVDSPESGYDT